MPSRRDVLQGCLLAGIFLGAPALAGGEAVRWTARWKVGEAKGGGLLVRVVVQPGQDTELYVVDGEDGGQGQVSGQLTATVGEEPRSVRATSDVPLYSRVVVRRQLLKVAAGESVELGPWTVDARPDEDVVLAVVLDATESVTLTHSTGKPSFAAVWEARPIGRSTASVFVSLTPDRDVVLRLMDGRPTGLSVRSGGSLAGDTRPMSRAGPRPQHVPLAKGDTRKVGGWLVQATEPVLSVALTLSHDRGQTHLTAEVPVKASDA